MNCNRGRISPRLAKARAVINILPLLQQIQSNINLKTNTKSDSTQAPPPKLFTNYKHMSICSYIYIQKNILDLCIGTNLEMGPERLKHM